MAFVTKLLIEQREIEVISYQFGFKKNTEEQNKPISSTSFNGLEIEIESTENTYFEEWMNSEKSKDKIELQIFYPYLEGGSKIMTFFDCYLIGFKTGFSANNTEPMKDRLRITCGGVKAPYSQIEYSTSWRKTFEQEGSNQYISPIVASGSTSNDKTSKKRVYDLRWIKQEMIIKDKRIIKQITLRASVDDFEEGENVNLTLTRHKKEINELGEKTVTDKEFDTVSGIVKNKKVEIIWEIDETI